MADAKSEFRPINEIFSDLLALCHSDGAFHSITSLVFRDWAIVVDTVDHKIVDSDGKRWSRDRLNAREITLLFGLCVQSTHDRIFKWGIDPGEFQSSADRLLEELHSAMAAETLPSSQEAFGPNYFRDNIGLIAREAFFYGADGYYYHQLAAFTRLRYRPSADWLLRNVGISIRPIVDIANYIAKQISYRMTAIGAALKKGVQVQPHQMTLGLTLSKRELIEKFGEKAKAFIELFSIESAGQNLEYLTPFSFNLVRARPLIDVGDGVFVASVRGLMESIFESPFYWMQDDPKQKIEAANNRGEFLESIVQHKFEAVFGHTNVFRNVRLKSGKKDLGEIDVLVIYGEFVIIVQAKSKKLTMSAASGDAEALKSDFVGAIQHPYEQAIACIQALKNGCEILDQDGASVAVDPDSRLFPVVALSDYFPASHFMAHQLLESIDGVFPAIWDIGVIDCICKIFPGPIDLLFFLQSRSGLFEKIIADSEIDLIGFHLRAKLAMPPETDFMMVESDFSGVVDDFMVSIDLGLQPERPKGVLEELDIPIANELIGQLRSAPPEMAALAIEIFDFSQESLERITATIEQIRNELRLSTKVLKSISVPTASGGISFVCLKERSKRALDAALDIGRRHKYEQKSDRWYVVVTILDSGKQIDAFIAINEPWSENAEEERNVARVDRDFSSRKVELRDK